VARRAGTLVCLPAGTATLRLPAPLGVLIGGPRALWPQLVGVAAGGADDAVLACAELALGARLLGSRWRVVTEAAAPPAEPALPPPAMHTAAARRHDRWGFHA
jgi:hypothetical protein